MEMNKDLLDFDFIVKNLANKLKQRVQRVLDDSLDNWNRYAVANLLSQFHQAAHDVAIFWETLQRLQNHGRAVNLPGLMF